jgi:hypothetical protein
MRVVAIALVLLMSAALSGEALGRAQTDWYSRGIIRQQTINGMTKKKQSPRRKKRKAHATSHRTTTKPKSVAKT